MSLPNFLAVVLSALKEDVAVRVLAPGGVHASLPPSPKYPLVRVSLLDTRPTQTQPAVHYSGSLQVDVFSKGNLEGFEAMSAIVEVLDGLSGATPFAFLTGVSVEGVSHSLDETFDAPLAWWRADVSLYGRGV